MTAIPTQRPLGKEVIPPLQSGDRLTREEFERRYRSMPSHVRAELIDGVVYMPSPVTEEFHSAQHADLQTWMGNYRAVTPGVIAGNNGTLRLDLKNEPQPDAYLRIAAEYGGQAKLSADGYVEGAAEFVAEVAATSANYDLHAKLDAYRRNQAREYLVWLTIDRQFKWFVLRADRYEPLAPGPDGIYRSEIFPGLWLDPAAMLRGDLATVLKVLQQGSSSPEHDAFVEGLRKAGQQGR